MRHFSPLPSSTPQKPFPAGLALLLLFNTAVIFGIYCYFVMRLNYIWVFWLYYAALAAVALGYVIYNRGFSREKLTLAELPSDWSDKQKADFLAERDERKKKSKWLLTLLFPLCLTIFFDVMYLFFGDTIAMLLGDVGKFLGIS